MSGELENIKRVQNNIRSNFKSYKKKDSSFRVSIDDLYFINKPNYADVYMIGNIINGKIYIGHATHVTGTDDSDKKYCNGYLVRYKKHIYSYKSYLDNPNNIQCSALYSGMKKYGITNFNVTCLCVCDKTIVEELEKYFINIYNSKAPSGYNLTDGGDGGLGRPMSESNKNKLREANLTINSDYYSNNIKNKQNDDNLLLRRCNETILTYIIAQKNILTTQEISNNIKKDFNVVVPRNYISTFFKGEMTCNLPDTITNTPQYISMVENNKRRTYNKKKTELFIASAKENTVKRRNFSEDQLMLMMKDKLTAYSAKECGSKYIGKNGNTISESSVLKIWYGKTLPLGYIDDDYKKLLEFKRSRRKKL